MEKLTLLLIILLLSGCVSAPVYTGGGVSCRGPMPWSTGDSGTAATGPPNPTNSIQQRMQSEINSWMGTPYVYGGVSKSGVDCSGFTQAVFRSVGIEIPRRASTQAEAAESVSRNNLQYGDLVFFNTSGSGISHCGIYLGNGEFVHSSSSRGVVRDLLSHPYYSSRFISAGRYL